MKPSYYVTTPIYYVNDKPHIGSVYPTLACDVLARFKRMDGYDVMFLTGTDEHGLKLAQAARKLDMTPQAFTDKISQAFRDILPIMNIQNDDFIRTTEERHIKACKALWEKLVENGDIYLGKYEGWYAVSDEAYYDESELHKGPDGKMYTDIGKSCEWMEEPSYFFRLSAWGDRLLAYYDQHPDFILPLNRRNEIISFVKSGLKDISVSRTTFDWGIPVPGDEKHVMYVWLDALTNYITALGYPDTGAEKYKKYWPADVHIVGKDIQRFHAIYWPAFLMAAGLEPPKRVYSHGWWTAEGQKMSKSFGNIIDPLNLVEKYGLDPTRYFMLRAFPFGQDGDFSHEAMVHRMNGDLANDIGNLAQRTLAQINKNCEAKLPSPGPFAPADEILLTKAKALLPQVRAEMDQQTFHKALDQIWLLIGDSNRYIDEQAPWALKKTDLPRMGTVLYVLAEVLRTVALLVHPFMPGSMDKLLDQLAVAQEDRTYASLEKPMQPGTPLPVPQGIFPRYIEPEDAAK